MIKQGMLAPKMKKAWESAIALDPKNMSARTSLIQYYLQAPGFMGGSIDKAKEVAKQITGLNPAEGHFVKTCKQCVEVAKRLNAKWMTVVPGFYENHLPLDIQTANVIDALRRGAEIFEPHGLIMVLEPLSDTPELYLRGSHQSYMICKAVKGASCKILYDIYHMQRNEGNLIANMDQCWDEIAYIQIGDNPGRNEPTTGEVNYKNIFKHLNENGYKGVLGMEHGNTKPGKEGELAVIVAYRECDSF